jgi:hypothetical protein
MTRRLLFTLSYGRIAVIAIRRQAEKQSVAFIESKIVQITHKCSTLHPVIFKLWPKFLGSGLQ